MSKINPVFSAATKNVVSGLLLTKINPKVGRFLRKNTYPECVDEYHLL
jgi:hypothetical protein